MSYVVCNLTGSEGFAATDITNGMSVMISIKLPLPNDRCEYVLLVFPNQSLGVIPSLASTVFEVLGLYFPIGCPR